MVNGILCVDAIDPADGRMFELCEVWGQDDARSVTCMAEANARLIAAAPDLLAALEALLDGVADQSYCGRHCQLEVTDKDEAEYQAVRSQARAAIAKAKGAAA
ncbi:hypothetical protein [Roseomonas haemaphysalidis]|uniref:DUF982 domain-containing protein n=1 Tax=Roseomonas haemaphysalidis TaxID=2768162 RepID=A0ABS3KVA3_9PROT|nr:hypothetical protein [Roseomonas haemaphysalidis]MBO1080870.1 hypothetical protein [Roseomonas haemaphysalidis]